jgi:hypothetical protein
MARRDAGLRRVSRLTRWLLAGSLALTGMFAALAARAFPGHASQQSSGVTTTTTVTSSQSDDSAQDDSSQLQAPATTPSASGGSGDVTSGGS